MTAQRRGVIPDPQHERLTKALRNHTTATHELRAAVIAALDAGGSVREVARVAGMSTNTIARWSKESRES